MLKQKIKGLLKYINEEVVLNKKKLRQMEMIIVSGVFALVGLVFTIINIIAKENLMAIITGTFSLVSIVTVILTIFCKDHILIPQILFVVSTLAMFTFFLIDGGAGKTEKDMGFSTYWIIVLPFLSMLVLGLKKGTLVTGFMFVVVCLLLWIPPLRENVIQWKPGETFYIRFPLVYLAAMLSSTLFEYSRYLTGKANSKLKEKYQAAACHDSLTGLTNRYGLKKIVENVDYAFKGDEKQEFHIFNCILIDIDDFKIANDKYGHIFGDEVLVNVATILRKYAGEFAIRFGGDEFVLLFKDKENKEVLNIGESIRKEISELSYASHPEARFTVSVGIASHEVNLAYKIDRVIELADLQSSRAKKEGKNCVYNLDVEKLTHNN